MSDPLAFGAQLAGNAIRFGWYFGLNRIVDRQAQRLGHRGGYKPRRPIPDRAELMASLAALFLSDAEVVRRGILPPAEPDRDVGLPALARARDMLDDLPSALDRRASEDAATAKAQAGNGVLPDYYVQDFHYQTGGYLSEGSARLYDVQVETLFYGAARAMRRAALPAIAEALRGRDQRQLALLDVACGTGRLLREIRCAWPALGLTGLDLSDAYLREARRHLRGVRPARLVEGNAEAVPLPDASQDVVTCTFLFHELPPDVRRGVAGEMARVLKPGGRLVFIDSLQMGDRPGWDGLLEAFPVRFHEPYYRHYVIDDLDDIWRSAGLRSASTQLAFLSKVIVCER